MKKGRRFFGWSKPTKRHPKICDLFFARLMFFSRKAPIQKRRRRRKAVAIRVCSSSNHVSCSESAIKIYGSKEEIRLQKSPETVDAPGFAPDASIPVTLYVITQHYRFFISADYLLPDMELQQKEQLQTQDQHEHADHQKRYVHQKQKAHPAYLLPQGKTPHQYGHSIFAGF